MINEKKRAIKITLLNRLDLASSIYGEDWCSGNASDSRSQGSSSQDRKLLTRYGCSSFSAVNVK